MSVFSSVLGNKVGRSVFDLSHVKRFTCDMGQLIPVYFDECVPGDTRKIGMQCVTRFQPLVAPILDSVDLTVHYFFVPTRLLMDKEEDWNTFLTGGVDGNDESVSLPLFNFGTFDGTAEPRHPFSNGTAFGKYSLWDYFGLPVFREASFNYNNIVSANHVLSFPQRAYNLVWNEFYRDPNLVGEASKNNSTILYRAWKKDYFTSALPWQQRGVAPALPLSGTVPVNFPVDTVLSINNPKFVTGNGTNYLSFNGTGNVTGITANVSGQPLHVDGYVSGLSNATADLSDAATFSVSVESTVLEVCKTSLITILDLVPPIY